LRHTSPKRSKENGVTEDDVDAILDEVGALKPDVVGQ